MQCGQCKKVRREDLLLDEIREIYIPNKYNTVKHILSRRIKGFFHADPGMYR